MREPEPREEPREETHRELRPAPRPAPETARHPVPGIEHEPESDAENIIPAEDRPGTL